MGYRFDEWGAQNICTRPTCPLIGRATRKSRPQKTAFNDLDAGTSSIQPLVSTELVPKTATRFSRILLGHSPSCLGGSGLYCVLAKFVTPWRVYSHVWDRGSRQILPNSYLHTSTRTHRKENKLPGILPQHDIIPRRHMTSSTSALPRYTHKSIICVYTN